MKSGSSALSSTSERAHSRSPWLIVTEQLAMARPACIGSTVISTPASGEAPRAKIVWTVLTRLSGAWVSPATTDWARSWPPNTTAWPVSAFSAR